MTAVTWCGWLLIRRRWRTMVWLLSLVAMVLFFSLRTVLPDPLVWWWGFGVSVWLGFIAGRSTMDMRIGELLLWGRDG